MKKTKKEVWMSIIKEVIGEIKNAGHNKIDSKEITPKCEKCKGKWCVYYPDNIKKIKRLPK